MAVRTWTTLLFLFLFITGVYSQTTSCPGNEVIGTVTSITTNPSILTAGGSASFNAEGSNTSDYDFSITLCGAAFYQGDYNLVFVSDTLGCQVGILKPEQDYDVTSTTFTVPSNMTAGDYMMFVILGDEGGQSVFCGQIAVKIQSSSGYFLELLGLFAVLVLS